MKSSFSLGRNKKQIWENIHLIMAFLVIIAAVITGFLFTRWKFMFAVCFFMAALMNIFHGIEATVPDEHHKRAIKSALFWFIMSLVCIALGVISIIALY